MTRESAAATELSAAVAYHVVNSLGWSDLRPLQRAAIAPVRSGADCILLAPTAGGKTEAAMFPLLSQMEESGWRGTSVLYLAPLRALLNNLHPRIGAYTAWLGRTSGLWHGDIGEGERRRILADRPDVLLTTPESLEAMLVSRRVDHRRFFANVRAVVIDEVHAFAGDDRGWHLLAVLERVQRLASRPIQRIGLSATVGNPDELLAWLQGSSAGQRPSRVVTAEDATSPHVDVGLDYVGSVDNAAEVISRLHVGEKRLVFCESRKAAEELAFALRERRVTTYVSHSSLSKDERRLSERAFAEDRDCVIVATSTLELGVDIGDLDRVIQVDAPRTVAAFLQRLGRTGRRPGTVRNMLFLATEATHLLRAAGLLLLWARGFVEPVTPPPAPRHIAAQQLLGLALQEGRLGRSRVTEWWGDLAVMDEGATILEHLRSQGFLAEDSGLLHIGPRAEEEFGRRYFMDLLSSFTTAPELRVVAGTKEIGRISPLAVPRTAETSERPILLAGRAWRIESVNWERFEILVSELRQRGKVLWPGEPVAESFEMCRAQREVLLGEDPPVTLSRRARSRLATLREEEASLVDPEGLVLEERDGRSVLWTWAGLRANETLVAALGDTEATADNAYVEFPHGLTVPALRDAQVEEALPYVGQDAVDGLKFSAALPHELAVATLAERHVDRRGAADIVSRPILVRTTPKAT